MVSWLFSAIIFCFSVVFVARCVIPRSWTHICCNHNTLNDSGKKCPNIFSTCTWSTFSHKLIFSQCQTNIAQISFKVGKKSNWIFFCWLNWWQQYFLLGTSSHRTRTNYLRGWIFQGLPCLSSKISLYAAKYGLRLWNVASECSRRW